MGLVIVKVWPAGLFINLSKQRIRVCPGGVAVSISVCHTDDSGSIPDWGVFISKSDRIEIKISI